MICTNHLKVLVKINFIQLQFLNIHKQLLSVSQNLRHQTFLKKICTFSNFWTALYSSIRSSRKNIYVNIIVGPSRIVKVLKRSVDSKFEEILIFGDFVEENQR